MTEYRTIPNYSRYATGSDGLVYSRRAGSPGRKLRPAGWRRLKGRPDGTVDLVGDDGRSRCVSIAGCVLRAWHGPRPIGCEAFRYPDPDPANNLPDNLRWAPRGTAKIGDALLSEASQRKRVVNRSFSDDEVAAILRECHEGVMSAEVAEREGVSRRTIDNIISGRSYVHVDGPRRARNRSAKGEAHPNSILSRARVRAILHFSRLGLSRREIARRLGCGQGAVRGVLEGKTWKELL